MKTAWLGLVAATFTLYSATSGGHARFFVTSAGSALIEQGLASAAPSGPELAAFQTVPKPGVRFEPNAASATTAPWVDSNAWRYQRGLKKANYETLPAGSAPLAFSQPPVGVRRRSRPLCAPARHMVERAARLRRQGTGPCWYA